jgi:hypothetical protein
MLSNATPDERRRADRAGVAGLAEPAPSTGNRAGRPRIRTGGGSNRPTGCTRAADWVATLDAAAEAVLANWCCWRTAWLRDRRPLGRHRPAAAARVRHAFLVASPTSNVPTCRPSWPTCPRAGAPLPFPASGQPRRPVLPLRARAALAADWQAASWDVGTAATSTPMPVSATGPKAMPG